MAHLNLIKNVPVFDGTGSYKEWKEIVALWNETTDIKEEKRGSVLILNMKGKPRELTIKLTNKSITNIFALLDSIYLESKNVVTMYEEFENFTRVENQSMMEYIAIFEQKVTELTREKLVLPDLVLAIKLMKGAKLSDQDSKVVSMSCSKDMKLEEMKTALCKLSLNSENTNKANNLVGIKEEPSEDFIFYNERFSNT